jgi:hypothetical protein
MRLRSNRVAVLALAALVGASSAARADDFDRLEGEALTGIPKSPDVTAHQTLTLAEIGNLPRVLQGARSALVVAQTDRGNLCRMLIAGALRKAPGGEGEPVPVLVLERFDTFEMPGAANRLARGKDLLLFDGFRVDLDSGQVVPKEQGGDVQFLAGAAEGPRLVAPTPSTLYTLATSPVPAGTGTGRVSGGRGVVPSDFQGRFHLFANGQWSGTLDLTLADRTISGRFRSDQTGSVYPVDGTVPADSPGAIRFAITYPRSRQDFEGHLWAEGKGAMAGTLTLLGQTFGFFALREGGHYAPEGDDVGLLAPEPDRPGRRVVAVEPGGRVTLDGMSLDLPGLTAALRQAAADDPHIWVLLRVPQDQTFATVSRVCEAVRAAGVDTLRLAVAEEVSKTEPGDEN